MYKEKYTLPCTDVHADTAIQQHTQLCSWKMTFTLALRNDLQQPFLETHKSRERDFCGIKPIAVCVSVYLVVAVCGRNLAAKHTYTNSHGKDSSDYCGLRWNRNLASLLKVHPCSKKTQTAKLQVHAYF